MATFANRPRTNVSCRGCNTRAALFLSFALTLTVPVLAQVPIILAQGESIDLCGIEKKDFGFLSASVVYDPQNPGSHNYRWEWFVDGDSEYTDDTDNIPSSLLPNYEIRGGLHLYQVKLYVDGFFIASSVGTYVTGTGNPGEYDAIKVRSRMVAGDFDIDGSLDDQAALYNYGSGEAAMHVWINDGAELQYQGDDGWWSSDDYDADKTDGRFTVCDFNGDGIRGEILAFYDYGNDDIRMHVWKSSGSGFSFNQNVWGSNDYDASKIKGRVVAGDFDNDGEYDDVAMMYDYFAEYMRLHVLKHTDIGGFEFEVWASHEDYNATKVGTRFVSGDFDNDGWIDDVAAIYDYGNEDIEVHVWKGNAGSFDYGGSWLSYDEYDAIKVNGRVASGDFDQDGYEDDIAMMYEYESAQAAIHVMIGSGGGFSHPSTWMDSGEGNFNASAVTGCFISHEPDSYGPRGCISAMYDYDWNRVRTFGWCAEEGSFSDTQTIWEICASEFGTKAQTPVGPGQPLDQVEPVDMFPNPSTGVLSFNGLPNSEVGYQVNVLDVQGRRVATERITGSTLDLSAHGLKPGLYTLQLRGGSDEVFIQRVLFQER